MRQNVDGQFEENVVLQPGYHTDKGELCQVEQCGGWERAIKKCTTVLGVAWFDRWVELLLGLEGLLVVEVK